MAAITSTTGDLNALEAVYYRRFFNAQPLPISMQGFRESIEGQEFAKFRRAIETADRDYFSRGELEAIKEYAGIHGHDFYSTEGFTASAAVSAELGLVVPREV